METKPNMAKESTTTPISENKIETVKKNKKHKHLKVKRINPSALNQTKEDHWINQGHSINQSILK